MSAVTEHNPALQLAAAGLRIFPLRKNGKLPAAEGWQGQATSDPEKIAKWAASGRNWGVCTGTERTNPDTGALEHLVVIDLDRKKGNDGVAALKRACKGAGFDLDVQTLIVQTPSGGGLHLYFWTSAPIRQGAHVLGPGSGVDVRAAGGYVVGPGSTIDGTPYSVAVDAPIAAMPAQLAALFPQGVREVKPADTTPLAGVDATKAHRRALDYLKTAPAAVEGQAGDQTTYRVAAMLKDKGCTQAQALELMADNWNDRCTPAWEYDELETKVRNAFEYGKDAPGIAAPEAVFPRAAVPAGEEATPHPLERMNAEFAFVLQGGQVIRETTDNAGRFKLEHLKLQAFENWFKNKPFQESGKKAVPMSEAWLEWSGRREYESFVFAPQRQIDARFYNLWRGFSVEPAVTGEHPMVHRFREHALENICGGDQVLCRWLMGFFAHMIQRPYEKPLVALVFKGKKGTGKNALIERICHLLGAHAFVADDERSWQSNFNGHLENNLLLVLDEAAWAGDKRGEGRLKGLITGKHHNIEHKGHEVFRVDNLTRVVMISNAAWVVPASADERRYAVFNVGDGRRQDRRYFEELRLGLDERGGAAYLLRFLLDFDLSGIDVNAAPATAGLVDQKVAALSGAKRWLCDAMTEKQLANEQWGDTTAFVYKHAAYDDYKRKSQTAYREFKPTDVREFWREIKDTLGVTQSRPRGSDAKRPAGAVFPPLDEARAAFEAHLGGPIDWGDADELSTLTQRQALRSAQEIFD